MNQFGNDFLACPGFACDQYRDVGWPYFLGQCDDGLDGSAFKYARWFQCLKLPASHDADNHNRTDFQTHRRVVPVEADRIQQIIGGKVYVYKRA